MIQFDHKEKLGGISTTEIAVDIELRGHNHGPYR